MRLHFPILFWLLLLVALATINPSETLAQGGDAAAAAPPFDPTQVTTLWDRLGAARVSKRLQAARANLVNRRGNLPALERKPPLKGIGDAANLESPVAAIKKAAEIKQQEDMVPQKLKAIKYLAGKGCGCYDKDGAVTKSLIASLDDCSEMVRLVTVRVLADNACREECKNCKTGSCCKPELLRKLQSMVYERDDYGCYKEPSARVREVAKEALCCCRPRLPDFPEQLIEEEPIAPPVVETGKEKPVLPPSETEEPEDTEENSEESTGDEVPSSDSDADSVEEGDDESESSEEAEESDEDLLELDKNVQNASYTTESSVGECAFLGRGPKSTYRFSKGCDAKVPIGSLLLDNNRIDQGYFKVVYVRNRDLFALAKGKVGEPMVGTGYRVMTPPTVRPQVAVAPQLKGSSYHDLASAPATEDFSSNSSQRETFTGSTLNESTEVFRPDEPDTNYSVAPKVQPDILAVSDMDSPHPVEESLPQTLNHDLDEIHEFLMEITPNEGVFYLGELEHAEFSTPPDFSDLDCDPVEPAKLGSAVHGNMTNEPNVELPQARPSTPLSSRSQHVRQVSHYELQANPQTKQKELPSELRGGSLFSPPPIPSGEFLLRRHPEGLDDALRREQVKRIVDRAVSESCASPGQHLRVRKGDIKRGRKRRIALLNQPSPKTTH